MKTHKNEKVQGRSSLATRGRFFLFFISMVSFFQPLNANVPNNNENAEIADSDSLRIFNNAQDDNAVKIYVTDGAQLTDLKNSITTPIVVIKVDNIKKFPKKKEKEKVRNNTKDKKNIQKFVQKSSSVPQFYFTNSQQKEFTHFNIGPDKAVVITTQQIKLFSINKLFVLNLLFLVSIYLVFFFKENTFFISITGKNFQRPPPYFSCNYFRNKGCY